MDFVKILGAGSALPVGKRSPTAQIIKNNENFFLIDCGEGTQLRIRENKVSFNRITHIFISHLHGDHFFGLPGLLSSFHLLGRTREVHLFGPKGLMEILDLQFKLSGTYLRYKINFTEVKGVNKSMIWEDKSIEVYSFPLNHRIDCHGYFFQEKKKPNHLIFQKLQAYSIPKHFLNNIKQGDDFVQENGKVISNEELTRPAAPPLSYAFCSDNRIKESLKEHIAGVDFLYHETTFMDSEKERAVKTFHSTAREAGKLAKAIDVKTLIIGHYSARYPVLEPLLKECQEEFENTILGTEGLEITIC